MPISEAPECLVFQGFQESRPDLSRYTVETGVSRKSNLPIREERGKQGILGPPESASVELSTTVALRNVLSCRLLQGGAGCRPPEGSRAGTRGSVSWLGGSRRWFGRKDLRRRAGELPPRPDGPRRAEELLAARRGRRRRHAPRAPAAPGPRPLGRRRRPRRPPRLRRRAPGRARRRAHRRRDRLTEEGHQVGGCRSPVQRHRRPHRELPGRRVPGLPLGPRCAFLDRALYLPKAWAEDRTRRARRVSPTRSRSRPSRSSPGACSAVRPRRPRPGRGG